VIALAASFHDLLAVLDRLEIPFFAGGSVASGTHGIPRQTSDIDLVADLGAQQIAEFCEALDPAFYADAEAMPRAIDMGRSFNVIHIEGAYKFDIFPVGQDRFARSQLARRRYATTTITGLEHLEFPVASPEDTILAKLVWFRRGGEVRSPMARCSRRNSRSGRPPRFRIPAGMGRTSWRRRPAGESAGLTLDLMFSMPAPREQSGLSLAARS